MINITKTVLTALQTGENIKNVDDCILHNSMNPRTLLSFLACSSGKEEYSISVCNFVEDIMDHMVFKRKEELEKMVPSNQECWPEDQYTLLDELQYEYCRFMR